MPGAETKCVCAPTLTNENGDLKNNKEESTSECE